MCTLINLCCRGGTRDSLSEQHISTSLVVFENPQVGIAKSQLAWTEISIDINYYCIIYLEIKYQYFNIF